MAAESRTNECRSLRSVVVLLKLYLKDEFSYGPVVEKKKKSKSPTIIFFEFFFKIFSKVWSSNNKVSHIWTKIGNFLGYRSAKSCSTAGWEGFGKTQLFLFNKILDLLQNWWIFLRNSAATLSFFPSVYSMCEIRRPYYICCFPLSLIFIVLCKAR